MKTIRYETSGVDDVDIRLLEMLAADARISLARISRALGISSPTASERIKRLEEANVIRNYTIEVSPEMLGRPLAVWLRVRPAPGNLSKVAAILQKTPEIVECDRITGDDCFLARAYLKDSEDLERLIDLLTPWSATNTSLIQSSPVKRRLPPVCA